MSLREAAMNVTNLELRDDFAEPLPQGAVLGSLTTSSHIRLGADVEGRLGVDHGALRLACPDVPGWGRLAIAYGPFTKQANRCAAFLLLNGHHGSQTRRVYSGRWRSVMRSRFTGLVRRLLVTGPVKRLVPRLGRVAPVSLHDLTVPAYRTNLRVGWFPRPDHPTRSALPGLCVAAAGARNGDLRAVVGGRELTVVPSITNIPLGVAILDCSHGTTFLVGGLAGARRLAPYPQVRPVAFDSHRDEPRGFLGIHQSVLGEVGFTSDSRVYGIGMGAWGEQCPCVTPFAAAPPDEPMRKVLDSPAGLLVARLPDTTVPVRLRFRSAGHDDYWEVRVGQRAVELGRCVGGSWSPIGNVSRPRRAQQLLVQDSGTSLLVAFDGRPVLGGHIEDDVLGEAAGVELGPGWDRTALTVLPRELPMPPHLVLGTLWQPGRATVLLRDGLSGEGLLDGHQSGDRRWRRVDGTGTIKLSDGPAQVDATPGRHNPGRSLHVVDWDESTVDISVTITPPVRSNRGENRGRAGIVLRRSNGDQLIVATYLDDWYVGRSVSSFVTVDGTEHFHRAVWTNVDDRVSWDRPYRLRVSFDGDRYLARIDDEPVLFRRISDVVSDCDGFRPDMVGLAVNEEFGNDSGSAFGDVEIGTLSEQ